MMFRQFMAWSLCTGLFPVAGWLVSVLLFLCFVEIPLFNANSADAAFCIVCQLPFWGFPDYEGPAKSFVTGFGLLQCYVLSNIFLLQTFKVFLLY